MATVQGRGERRGDDRRDVENLQTLELARHVIPLRS